MATFLGHPVRPISLFVVYFYEVIWKEECFRHVRQSQTKNFWRNNCHITYHVRVVVVWTEFISSYSNLEWRRLTCFVFKSNFFVTFLKNGKYLSFNLHSFGYILETAVDLCTFSDAEWNLPHSVRCLYNSMSQPVIGEKYCKVLLSQRLFSTNSMEQGPWEVI
jgi:hypothetical protein